MIAYQPTIHETVKCAVCRQRDPQKHSEYCSAECRASAYNMRKRLAEVKTFLSSLGFVLTYHNGIRLTTRLPQEIHYAFPRALAQFDFMEPLYDCDNANADHYWAAFTEILGSTVASFIRWQFDNRERYHPTLAVDLMRSTVKVTFSDRSFRCQFCGMRFIDSLAARNSEINKCTDCLTKEIPF